MLPSLQDLIPQLPAWKFPCTGPTACMPCTGTRSKQKLVRSAWLRLRLCWLQVRAESYNGRPLFGNGGSVTDSSSPDRWGGLCRRRLPAASFLHSGRCFLQLVLLPGMCRRPGQGLRCPLECPVWSPAGHHPTSYVFHRCAQCLLQSVRSMLCCTPHWGCRENNVEQVSLDDLPEGRVSIEVRQNIPSSSTAAGKVPPAPSMHACMHMR